MMEEKIYIDCGILFIAIVSLTITFFLKKFISTRLSKIRKKEAKKLDEMYEEYENRGGIVARGPGRPWPPRQNWMI